MLPNIPRSHPQLRTFWSFLSHLASDPTFSQSPGRVNTTCRHAAPQTPSSTALTWLTLLPPPWLFGHTVGPIIWNVLLPGSHIVPISSRLGLCFNVRWLVMLSLIALIWSAASTAPECPILSHVFLKIITTKLSDVYLFTASSLRRLLECSYVRERAFQGLPVLPLHL